MIIDGNLLEKVEFPSKSKLKTLRCNSNKLKDVDLSNNSQLAYLNLARN